MADILSQNNNFLLGYFKKKDNALCYRYEAEQVIIEPWGSNALRIRATRKGSMPQQDWALLLPQGGKDSEIIRVSSGSVSSGSDREKSPQVSSGSDRENRN